MMADDRPPPTIDPTALTTTALLREIANLRENISVRLDAMDKAMTLFQENLVRVPTEVQREVGNLKELHGARFEQAERALAAALHAQKDLALSQDTSNGVAITKAQDATDKQIDAIKAMVEANRKSLDDKIAIINGRLDRGEAGPLALREHGRENRDHTSMIIATLALAAAIGMPIWVHFLK